MADGTWPARRLPCIDSEIAATGLTLKVEEYWRSVLQGRSMPARRDIDPADLRRLLPNIFLLDVVERGTRFRWRLVGTRIGDLERGEHTGKWVQDTILHSQDPFIEFCRMTVAERRPTCHAALRADLDGGNRPLIRSLLPLSEDGAIVSMLLGAVDYSPSDIVPLEHSGRPNQALRPMAMAAAMPMPLAVPR
ncbi:MAG: PAS domain-containing protein [Aliidongia sp.]